MSAPRGSDAKARPRAGGRYQRPTTSAGRAAAKKTAMSRRSREIQFRHLTLETGTVWMRDYGRRGNVSGVLIGVTGPKGGMSADPVLSISYRIRAALNPQMQQAPIVIYDAVGRAVATVNPLTRVRTPL